jgi:sterol carrier protein 2
VRRAQIVGVGMVPFATVYGDSTSGQRALYRVGLIGLPVVNVNNNCSTGSSALWLAPQAVASGAADCVLALGFEQMRRGALGSIWDDRPSPFGRFDEVTDAALGEQPGVPGARQVPDATAALQHNIGLGGAAVVTLYEKVD